jgi:hypothetical protein
MALEIGRNGIVRRQKEGVVTIWRPGTNGGPITQIEVAPELADGYRLATGDIVEGETEPIFDNMPDGDHEEDLAMPPGWDTQHDEPSALRHGHHSDAPATKRYPTERLTRVIRINGLSVEEAEVRPFPRTKRSQSERTPPDRLLALADGPDDATGRTLEFATPLGAGVFGLIHGPHGGGLTRTLQTVLQGIGKSAPDFVPMALLLRPRAEEVTEWRRKNPDADVVVASTAFGEGTPEETLELCALMLEAAQRQTELGRDVVLLIDSLTALWAAMLEAEEADAQHEADLSAARQRMREWTQKAGCFHGETPLGGGLRGSLTILGTVWHQAIDEEAEEERDTHPHLRLLEHTLPEASWLVALSGLLTRARLYPAIDVKQCRSQYEERLLPPELVEPLLTVRGSLPRNSPLKCYMRVMDALEASTDITGLLDMLARPVPEESVTEIEPDSRPPGSEARAAARERFLSI